MSYSKLIHEYLDGGLEEARKEALFSELAANPEIRQEFDRQVSINNIARMDMNSISPPLETTNALFSSLGFSIPSGDVAMEEVPSGNGKYAAALALIKKHYPLLGAAFLASAVTALLFSLFYTGPDNTTDMNFAENSGRNSIPVVSSYEDENNVNTRSDDAISANNLVAFDEFSFTAAKKYSNSNSRSDNNYRNNINGINSNSGITDRSNQPANDNRFADNDITNSSDTKYGNTISIITPTHNSEELIASANHLENGGLISRNNASNELAVPVNVNGPGAGSYFDTPGALNYNPYIDNTKMFLQVRGFSMNSNVDFNSGAGQNAISKNFAIGAFYRLNNNWAVMLETGNEAFPMEFTSVIDGRTGLQQQSPERFWLGTGVRYTMDDLGLTNWLMLKPYSQVFAAYSSLGPVFRGQAGLSMRYRGISFSLGYELSTLLYNVDGNIYNTRKSGITYGFNYHF